GFVVRTFQHQGPLVLHSQDTVDSDRIATRTSAAKNRAAEIRIAMDRESRVAVQVYVPERAHIQGARIDAAAAIELQKATRTYCQPIADSEGLRNATIQIGRAS